MSDPNTPKPRARTSNTVAVTPAGRQWALRLSTQLQHVPLIKCLDSCRGEERTHEHHTPEVELGCPSPMPSVAPATQRGDSKIILDSRRDIPGESGLRLVSGVSKGQGFGKLKARKMKKPEAEETPHR